MTAELARRAADAGRLAIDTEFMSERRYQAMLCLAQLAVADPDESGGVRTEILDPIEDELDTGPLAAVLADPAVEIVVHAGRQDVAILKRTWQTDIQNVFDTQVAAGFLGYGVQEGYGSLVRKVLGIELLAVALVAERGGHDALKVAEVTDPLMAVGHQMLDGSSSAAQVVGENRIRIEERWRPVDEHEWRARLALIDEVAVVMAGGHDH